MAHPGYALLINRAPDGGGKIATLADTWGITIAPHLFPELNVHLLASIPNGICAENMGLLDDLWVDPLQINRTHSLASKRPHERWISRQV
jgi:hypothetical protein